jgi:hypothetical protein
MRLRHGSTCRYTSTQVLRSEQARRGRTKTGSDQWNPADRQAAPTELMQVVEPNRKERTASEQQVNADSVPCRCYETWFRWSPQSFTLTGLCCKKQEKPLQREAPEGIVVVLRDVVGPPRAAHCSNWVLVSWAPTSLSPRLSHTVRGEAMSAARATDSPSSSKWSARGTPAIFLKVGTS